VVSGVRLIAGSFEDLRVRPRIGPRWSAKELKGRRRRPQGGKSGEEPSTARDRFAGPADRRGASLNLGSRSPGQFDIRDEMATIVLGLSVPNPVDQRVIEPALARNWDSVGSVGRGFFGDRDPLPGADAPWTPALPGWARSGRSGIERGPGENVAPLRLRLRPPGPFDWGSGPRPNLFPLSSRASRAGVGSSGRQGDRYRP